MMTDTSWLPEANGKVVKIVAPLLPYLKGGFDSWKSAQKEVDTVNRISPQTFEEEWSNDSYVVDVRKETEYAAEHVDEAYNKPLDSINNWFMEMDDSKPFYLHCAGGYRSMIAASILKSRGVHNFKEVDGGFAAIAKTQLPKTDFVCQSKLQKLS